jgi:hypothetical protein
VADADRDAISVAVRILPAVWREEVERLDNRSAGRVAAERERRALEQAGINLAHLERCSPDAPHGTRLGGLVKTYVPIRDTPPSVRPFGFVFAPTKTDKGVYLDLVAFGERHPKRGTRSVYKRAHKRRHGRYPRQ